MSPDFSKSVVLITSKDPKLIERRAFGTGFVIHQDEGVTYLLTCAHVVRDVGGRENVIVRGNCAQLVDCGKSDADDLAVLAVAHRSDIPSEKQLDELPPLKLGLYGKRSRRFVIHGYYSDGTKTFKSQKVKGQLGDKENISNPSGDIAPIWKLKVDDGDDNLQSGYSGSPVIDEETGYVVGVAAQVLDSQGKRGEAISVESLEGIWQKIPPNFIKQPAEPSPKLPAQKAQLAQYNLHSLLLASVATTVFVMVIRFLGLLQPVDLFTYDLFLKFRRHEEPDRHTLVVKLTDQDFEKTEISYQELLQVLQALQQSYSPQVIGLDVYVDNPEKPYYRELVNYLNSKDASNIVATCLVAPKDVYPKPGQIEGAISEISSERQGFSNIRSDGFLGFGVIRRYQLTYDQEDSSTCKTGFSLGFSLALRYLEAKGFRAVTNELGYMENKEGDIQIGKTVIQELKERAGGYQWRRIGGYQVLLNYRSSGARGAFEIAPISQIINKNVDRRLIDGRVILIGYGFIPSQGKRDIHKTPYGEMPGVFIQAHLVSQIINSVLDQRVQLSTWPVWIEILWVWFWTLVGSGLAWLRPSARLFVREGVTLTPLFIICFIFLQQQGWWVPCVPSAITLLLVAWILRRVSLLKVNN
jgi:CHASE2 domain-containing sensor protein